MGSTPNRWGPFFVCWLILKIHANIVFMDKEKLAEEINRVISEMGANAKLEEIRSNKQMHTSLCAVPRGLFERLVLYSGALAALVAADARKLAAEEAQTLTFLH